MSNNSDYVKVNKAEYVYNKVFNTPIQFLITGLMALTGIFGAVSAWKILLTVSVISFCLNYLSFRGGLNDK